MYFGQTGTSANVHDIVETSKLNREYDEVVYGDSGYQGADKNLCGTFVFNCKKTVRILQSCVPWNGQKHEPF
ncbi:MAG: hypothetical protein K2I03_00385 [Lachnospiraceae bacterium]|nr:hypothetical protein [Lachnospiraceae bacterium]